MFAARGIAKADHLDPFIGKIDGIRAPARSGINPLRTKEFRRRLGPAGGDKQGKDRGNTGHVVRMAELG